MVRTFSLIQPGRLQQCGVMLRYAFAGKGFVETNEIRQTAEAFGQLAKLVTIELQFLIGL